MGHAGGKLLEGHVGNPVQKSRMDSVEALGHMHHACFLEGNGIHGPRDDEVVADGDGVTILFSRPPPDPGPPRAVTAEHARDLVVITGQIVLGKEIDKETRSGGLAIALLLG